MALLTNARVQGEGGRVAAGVAEAVPQRPLVMPRNTDACMFASVRGRLRDAGLRPTRQRLMLGWLLFGRGDRHLSAETLYEEAVRARVPVSLATVYNTLNQFTEAGLLRSLAMEGSRTIYDTNTDDHHHYVVDGEEQVFDVPSGDTTLAGQAVAPPGFEIMRVEVVVRLRRLAAAGDMDPAPDQVRQ